jgi:hypothetical protein
MEKQNLQTPEENLSQLELSNVYKKLSINEDYSNFDLKEEFEKIISIIEKIYDKSFKQITTKDLSENEELINKSFAELFKFCREKRFSTSSKLFLVYCDYFDLDYNRTYNALHEKLRIMIKKSSIRILGKECFVFYEKLERANSVNIPTLFDLIK